MMSVLSGRRSETAMAEGGVVMAYFPNGSAGEVFRYQCSQCRYGDGPCPIFWVQYHYNYDACNNKTAREILDYLVHNDGSCAMFQHDPETFRIKE